MTGNTGSVVGICCLYGTCTCAVFCAIYPIGRTSGSLWRVIGILHQADVVATPSSVLVPATCCDAIVDVFSPREGLMCRKCAHIWQCCAPGSGVRACYVFEDSLVC